MPNFASKTQRANKYAGPRAPQIPAPGLQPGLHRKTTFCFSASTCRQDSHTIHFAPAGNCLSPTAGRHLSGRFFTEHYAFWSLLLPSRRQPATAFRRISFCTSPHNLPQTYNLHSGLTGQYIPALILSLFFFHSTPLYTKKETGKADFHLFFLQSQTIPNLVQI